MSKAKPSKAKAARAKSPNPAKSTANGVAPTSRRRRWLGLLAFLFVITLIVIVSYALRGRTAATESLPSASPAAALAMKATATLRPTAALPLGPADACRKHPRFARALGFDERAYLTTSSPSLKGVALMQPNPDNTLARVYQDPSWTTAGWLGHMTFDEQGNVYLFPTPRVSLVDNPLAAQNTLYRIDSDEAQMTPLITITTDFAPSTVNPFGLLGTTYDCDTHSLYAATVAGSTATAEVGKIVRIDLATVAVVAELQGIDPFGLTVYNEPAGKRLYFGAARTAEIYSIGLTPTGDFVGQPQLELALPDRSLKPWRIGWENGGDLVVRATPFDFNLIATSEHVEVPFHFRRDAQGLWQLLDEPTE